MSTISEYALWFDDIPRVCFCKRSIDVFLNLTLKTNSNMYYSRNDIYVCIEVVCKSTQHVATENILNTFHEILDRSGRLHFTFEVATPSLTDMEIYLRAFVVNNPNIISCNSNTFITVERKLCITTQNLPAVVYNDNKGDKHVDISVQLKNADGQVVTGRVVPLKVTLRYGTGELVHPTYIEKPTLIQLQPEHPQVESDGTCVVKARIMQITRNHNNRQFVIRIEPDLGADINNCDIGYAECGPIEVRTKVVENKSVKVKRKSDVPQCSKACRTRRSFRVLSEASSAESSADASASQPSTEESSLMSPELLSQLDAWVGKLEKLKWKETGHKIFLNEEGTQVETSEPLYNPPYPNDYIDALIYEYEYGGLRNALANVINDISIAFAGLYHS